MLNALFVAVSTSMRAGFGADADCSSAIRIDEKAGGGERGIKLSSGLRDEIARMSEMGQERPICDGRGMSASPPEATKLLRGIR
jgi:hypothetical protein